jgi:Predicted transcription factor, homolog of eukaryotic MBF1
MDELKPIFASNLIKLRTAAGMTQAELGEKLNYSDKSISKWERAEALPDASIMKKLSDLFGVTVDGLLSRDNFTPRTSTVSKHSRPAIVWVSLAGIWTLAVLSFVIFWIAGSIHWIIFAYSVPASLIVVLVLNSIWNAGKHNVYIVSVLVLTVIAILYFSMPTYNPWQLFLVAVPAELVVFFSFRIRKNHK